MYFIRALAHSDVELSHGFADQSSFATFAIWRSPAIQTDFKMLPKSQQCFSRFKGAFGSDRQTDTLDPATCNSKNIYTLVHTQTETLTGPNGRICDAALSG